MRLILLMTANILAETLGPPVSFVVELLRGFKLHSGSTHVLSLSSSLPGLLNPLNQPEVLPAEQLPQPWDKKLLADDNCDNCLSPNERVWSMQENRCKFTTECPSTHKAGLLPCKAPRSPHGCSAETGPEDVPPSHTQRRETQTASTWKSSLMHQSGYHFY